MAKLSLITLHSVQNYGSALQSYATQCLFESLGWETEVVDYVRENNLRENIVDTCLRNSVFWNKNWLTRAIFLFLKKRDLEYRYDLFQSFLNEFIHLTPHRYVSDEDFLEYPILADCYCTGSDQTWNSYWNRGILGPFFLTFAPKGKKKIAYASSFGKQSLDVEEKKLIKQLLQPYTAITVREQEAVNILSDLGLQGERVLDPTLMLTGAQWRSFATERLVKEPYLLIYQLGYDRTFNQIAKQLAKHQKCKLIRIGFGNEAYLHGGKVIKNPGVREFLSLLANASGIITDSFHATSFAVNLNVPFYCWLPKVFSGRISDFLALTGLESRQFQTFEQVKKISDQTIAFERVNEIIERERNRSLQLVKQMLEE